MGRITRWVPLATAVAVVPMEAGEPRHLLALGHDCTRRGPRQEPPLAAKVLHDLLME